MFLYEREPSFSHNQERFLKLFIDIIMEDDNKFLYRSLGFSTASVWEKPLLTALLSIDSPSPVIQLAVATMYMYGTDQVKNEQKAVEILKELAQSGHSDAQ